MKKNAFLSFLLAFVLLLSSCSVVGEEPEKTEKILSGNVENDKNNIEIIEPFSLRIPFDFKEGFAPYEAKSKTNRFVCSLLYRSMVRLTSSYRYELNLLSSIATEDNITWYLYLDDDLTFPNGTEFTAYDLKYSIQQAMEENSYYASSLEIVQSVSVVNANCCRVILHYADKHFPNLLTFPVISYETIRNPLFFPDRYVLSDNGTTLVGAENSDLPVIELIASDNPDLLVYEMRMGRYDCVYCRDPLSLGTSSAGALNGLQSNRMVYLGFNSGSAFPYYSAFRKAVASAIDYEYLSTYIYNYFASEPKGIYSPDFFEVTYTAKRSLDIMSANFLLDDMGLTNRDSDNFRTNSRGKRIRLSLIVCGESSVKVTAANAIAEMLREIGVEVSVTSLSYSAFLTALEKGSYDLYLAEVRIGADMDFSRLITPWNYTLSDIEYINYGMNNYEGLYLQWLGYMGGTVTATEWNRAFDDVMPFIPLCYAKSSVIFSRDLPFVFGGTDFDMFYNIESWKTE